MKQGEIEKKIRTKLQRNGINPDEAVSEGLWKQLRAAEKGPDAPGYSGEVAKFVAWTIVREAGAEDLFKKKA